MLLVGGRSGGREESVRPGTDTTSYDRVVQKRKIRFPLGESDHFYRKGAVVLGVDVGY